MEAVQDLLAFNNESVTKGRPGLGFTVKQDATTIHEHGAAYTILMINLPVVRFYLLVDYKNGSSRTCSPMHNFKN